MSKQNETALLVPESKLDLQAAVAVQQAYLEACKALLDNSDYAEIRGRKHRKRSGWAKLRRAFAVNCEIISEHRQELDDDWGYLFIVRAALPNGRFEDSEGSCMASELSESFIWPTLHNVRAKALTRAKNRATADVLGAGIVSAEETPTTTRHWLEFPGAHKRFWAWTKGDLGLSEKEVHQFLEVDSVYDFKGTKDLAFNILKMAAKAKKEVRAEKAAADQKEEENDV